VPRSTRPPPARSKEEALERILGEKCDKFIALLKANIFYYWKILFSLLKAITYFHFFSKIISPFSHLLSSQ
jgi:hypothetical protein